MKNLVAAIIVTSLSATTFASGFKCTGDGVNVKLFNSTSSTRTPSAMIISSSEDPETMLRRTGDSISKKNLANSIQYITDGNAAIGAETVILQIAFKEGRDLLKSGDTVSGKLVLVKEDGSREVLHLECSRYLKGE